MAAPVRHVVCHRTSNPSRTRSASSSKSFSSWGSRKRPRDSLEKTRETINSVAIPDVALTGVRHLSVQREEEEEENQSFQSVPLIVSRHLTASRRSVCERYPRGKSSLLVFFLNLLAFYAFGVALIGILDFFYIEKTEMNHDHAYHFIKLMAHCGTVRLFYPLCGLIADVYIGRWRMIQTAFLLLVTGYMIIVVLFALVGQSSVQIDTSWCNAIGGVAFLFVSIGGGAFEATIIPFGVDQLQGASSAEISSYFFSFYASNHLGIFIGVCVSCAVSRTIQSQSGALELKQLYSVFVPLITAGVLTVGLILMICLHHWFFKNTLWENPVKLIAKILCYAATVKRHLPVRNRAFRYGEEKKNRIELAKITYDGKFPDEKVEDVKAFCRIFFILLTLIPTMFCRSSVSH